MLKTFVSLCCLVALGLLGCSQSGSVNSESLSEDTAQGVHFVFEPSQINSLAKFAKEASSVQSIRVTILDSNETAVYTNHNLSLVASNITEPLKLPVGDYQLSGFEALDALGNTLYAAPKDSTELGQLIRDPLNISFTVSQGDFILVVPTVLSINNRAPEAFGYMSFTSFVPSFLLKVTTQTFSVDNQGLRPVDGVIEVTVRDTAGILQTSNYTVEGGTDVIRILDVVDSTYTFKVTANGLDTITRLFPYDSLTSGQASNTIFLKEFFLDSTVYRDWAHVGTLTFNTTVSGADISTDLEKYPTLVRITDPVVFAQSQSNGEDLRFSKLDNSTISYEIESWDSSSSSALVWVHLDTVYGNNNSQSIRMHWGNAIVSSNSSSRDVFDPAQYAGVWHMNEAPIDSAFLSVRDRTPNGNHFTPLGGMSASNQVAGVIGNAIDFDGSDDYLALGGLSQSFSNGLSMCAWVNYDAFNNNSRIWDCGNGSASENISLGNNSTNNILTFQVLQGGSSNTLNSSGVLSTGSWDYVCGVTDAAQQATLYRNGVSIQSGTVHLPNDLVRRFCYLGRAVNSSTYLDAQVDEFRIGKFVPSADWIKLNYESQRAGTTWMTFTR
jgi:hypothetical protein